MFTTLRSRAPGRPTSPASAAGPPRELLRLARRCGADDGRRGLPADGDEPAVFGLIVDWLRAVGADQRVATRETLRALGSEVASLTAQRSELAASAASGTRQRAALGSQLLEIDGQIAALIDQQIHEPRLLADRLDELVAQADGLLDRYWIERDRSAPGRTRSERSPITAPAWFADPLA